MLKMASRIAFKLGKFDHDLTGNDGFYREIHPQMALIQVSELV